MDKMSCMCEHTIRVRERVVANEITLCKGLFLGFNLREKTNMHSKQDAIAEKRYRNLFPKA